METFPLYGDFTRTLLYGDFSSLLFFKSRKEENSPRKEEKEEKSP